MFTVSLAGVRMMLGFHFKRHEKVLKHADLKTHDFSNMVRSAQDSKQYRELQQRFSRLTVDYQKRHGQKKK